MTIDLETLDIVAPALVTGLLVTAAHVPLGTEVLKRGIIFIDLAMAQAVGLVLVVLALWLEEPSWTLRQAASFGAGIGVALFFRWIERVAPDEQEAVIGSSFIVAGAATLLALANNPRGGEDLQHVLSGQLLFVSWGDLAAFLPIYAAVTLLRIAFPGARRGVGFFVTFALAITASVQLVGVYVVFASLILPALSARTDRGYVPTRAFAGGAAAVVAAIAVSTVADLPAGPVLVVCFAAAAAATRGILHRRRRRGSVPRGTDTRPA